jgi:glycosyltransferase involved in cell wall biosynthesis
MKVLGVAITPPSFKASGGVSAGIQLMKHVANLTDTRMLVMAEAESEERDGLLAIDRIPTTNILDPIRTTVPRSLHTLMWRADFGRWFDRFQPDIVHFHNPHPPGALASAAAAARKRGIPYVISTHGYVEFSDFATAFGAPAWQRPILDRLVRRPVVDVTARADRVLMLSPEERALLLNMGADEERLDVVPNGVDAYFLEPVPLAEQARLLERFALPDNRPLIFFVGNHTPNKGIDTLLGAMARMRADAVAVIGGGMRSAAEHAALLADAGFDMASGRAIFTDFLNREELRALYRRCDIFAFPSRADTLPLVILEAMISGKPVVSTRIGGIPFEVTADTGILIDPGRPDALANALDSLVADPGLRERMGKAGRERALSIFNWETSAAHAMEIYQDVVSHKETRDKRAHSI